MAEEQRRMREPKEDKYEEVLKIWTDLKNCDEELRKARDQRALIRDVECKKEGSAFQLQKRLVEKCTDFLWEKEDLVSKLEEAGSQNRKHEESLEKVGGLNRSLEVELKEMRASKETLEETLKVTLEKLKSAELRLKNMSGIKDEVSTWQGKHQELSFDLQRTKKDLEEEQAKLISSQKLNLEELEAAKSAAAALEKKWKEAMELGKNWESRHESLSSDFETVKKELEHSRRKLSRCESDLQDKSKSLDRTLQELGGRGDKLAEALLREKRLLQGRERLLKKLNDYFRQEQQNLARTEHELKNITEQPDEFEGEGWELNRNPQGSGYPTATMNVVSCGVLLEKIPCTSQRTAVDSAGIEAEMDGTRDVDNLADGQGIFSESEQLWYEGMDSEGDEQVSTSPSPPTLTKHYPLKRKAATLKPRYETQHTRLKRLQKLNAFPLKNDIRRRHHTFASQNSLAGVREKKGRHLTESVKLKHLRWLYYCSKCHKASNSPVKARNHRLICCPDRTWEDAVVKSRSGCYGRYKCPLCLRRYASLKGFSIHCGRAHEDYRQGFTCTHSDKKLKCDNCQDTFADPAAYHRHLNEDLACSQPPEEDVEMEDSPWDDANNDRLKLIGKNPRSSRLQNRLQSMANAKPKLDSSIPPGIGTSSVEKIDTEDLTSIHVLKEALTCGVCKRIGKKMNIIAECLRSHGVYRCAICFNTFLSKEEHCNHKKLCHTDNSGGLKCPICSETGRNSGVLMRHMLSTHWKPMLEENAATDMPACAPVDQNQGTDTTEMSGPHRVEAVCAFPAAESTAEAGSNLKEDEDDWLWGPP